MLAHGSSEQDGPQCLRFSSYPSPIHGPHIPRGLKGEVGFGLRQNLAMLNWPWTHENSTILVSYWNEPMPSFNESTKCSSYLFIFKCSPMYTLYFIIPTCHYFSTFSSALHTIAHQSSCPLDFFLSFTTPSQSSVQPICTWVWGHSHVPRGKSV